MEAPPPSTSRKRGLVDAVFQKLAGDRFGSVPSHTLMRLLQGSNFDRTCDNVDLTLTEVQEMMQEYDAPGLERILARAEQTGALEEQDSQRRHALVNEWNTLVNRLRSNGVHFLVPPSQPEAVAYELSMMASGTDCRMCISALGSLLEGVHMMQIPFPKELPFAASELFPATFDASETLLKPLATKELQAATAALKPYDVARKKLVRTAARVTVVSQTPATTTLFVEEDAELAQCLQRMKQALLMEERADKHVDDSATTSEGASTGGVSSRVWCFLGGLSFLAELAHPVAALADTSTAPLWSLGQSTPSPDAPAAAARLQERLDERNRMTANELLLQMIFSEEMLKGGGKWAKECEQRRVEFLGFAPQRKLERRSIGDWVRWGLTDPDAAMRLACVVQLLDHAERWAPHFLMGTAAGVVPLLLERLDLESHHLRHESEPAIRHYLLLLLHAVCQGGAESLLTVFRQCDGARVLTRLLQGPCGVERPAASSWEAEETAADVVDRAAHAGGPSLMRVGGAAGAGRAWRTQQRVAERSLVPGVWHYAADFSAPDHVADTAARVTHWEREEEELGTCLTLVCWCLATDEDNGGRWGAWLLEYPFVAAVLSAPHIQASLDMLSKLLSHPAMPSHLSALQEATAAASIQTVQGAVVDAGWGGALLTLPGTAMPAWDQAMRSALWPHLKKAALLRVLVSLKLAVARAVKRAMEDVRRTAMEMSEAPAQRAPAQRPMRVPLAVRVDDPASNEQPIEAEVTKLQLPPSDTMAESLATFAPGAPQDDAVPSPPPDSVSMEARLYVGRETQRVLKAEATLLRLLATWAPVHRDELPALFVSALTGLRHHLRHRHILRVRDDPAAAAAGTSGDVADTLFVSVHTLELVAARFQLPAAMSQTITRMVAAVPLVARGADAAAAAAAQSAEAPSGTMTQRLQQVWQSPVAYAGAVGRSREMSDRFPQSTPSEALQSAADLVALLQGGNLPAELQAEGKEALSPLAAHLLFELTFYNADVDEEEVLYAEEDEGAGPAESQPLSPALPGLLGLHLELLDAACEAAEGGGWMQVQGDAGLQGVRVRLPESKRGRRQPHEGPQLLELLQVAGRWQVVAPNGTLPLNCLLKQEHGE